MWSFLLYLNHRFLEEYATATTHENCFINSKNAFLTNWLFDKLFHKTLIFVCRKTNSGGTTESECLQGTVWICILFVTKRNCENIGAGAEAWSARIALVDQDYVQWLRCNGLSILVSIHEVVHNFLFSLDQPFRVYFPTLTVCLISFQLSFLLPVLAAQFDWKLHKL